MRRITVALSSLLLALLSVAVAEAALLALLFLFSAVLKLQLLVEIGGHFAQMAPAGDYAGFPSVSIQSAGTIASILFTLACGMLAAARQFRRWRPA